MNLLFNKNELINCLKNIHNIINNDNINNVLSSILINATNNQVIIQATNGNESYQEFLQQVKINQEGTVLIKCDLLLNIVSKLNHQEISFIKIEQNLVQISTAGFSCEINAWEESNFPALNFNFDQNNPICLKDDFLEILSNKLLLFVNNNIDQSFAITTGILINPIDQQNVECVATDNIRLAYYKFHSDKPFQRFVLSSNILKLARMLNNQSKQETKLFIQNDRIILQSQQITIIANLFDSNCFPNVIPVLMKTYPNFFTINKNQLLDALSLSNIFASDNVIITLQDKQLNVKCSDLDIGNSFCHLALINSNLDTFSFRINHKKLIEILNHIDQDEISFYCNGNNSPFILKTKDENYVNLILPLKSN